MKQKTALITILFIMIFSVLTADPTFYNSYPYQDLWPDYFCYSSWDGTSNVVRGIDGGFLLQSFVNPGYEFYEEPQSIFWKITDSGELEWRKQDIEIFHPYFRTIVSNGEDRYYAMAGPGGMNAYAGELFILDENCDTISTHNYLEEDSLDIKINSMQLLNDGLIMAGRLYEVGIYWGSCIIKTDFGGDIIWKKDGRDYGIEYEYADPELNTIIQTSDSCFLTCGHREMSPGTGSIFKLDSQGDTLWTVVQDDYEFLALLEYSPEQYYAFCHHFSNGSTSLVSIDSNGNILEEHFLLTDIISQCLTSRLLTTSDGNILIIYNAEEGEIHKVIPEGEILWSRDYLANETRDYPDWIGKNDKKGFQMENGDYVYCGTTDRQSLYPEHVLLRVDEDGNFSVSNDNKDHHKLITNNPNPFVESTTISFSLKNNRKRISLDIYNIKGQRIKALLNNELVEGGSYDITWDGTNRENNAVSSGIYFINLSVNSRIQATRKIIFMR